MDTPQSAPDPARDRGQLIFGVILTVVIFVLLVGAFTLLIIKSGGQGNYYNDIMVKGAASQGSAGK
jgi:hypothetical protein